MAKTTSKKSFKSLFSKSEVSQAAPVEKDADKRGREKKNFKFLKFIKKSKNDERPENQQVLSAVEPSITAEDREAWADNIATKSKKFSLYGTSPRSKGKEFSYSELDLRKPKRLNTFSFGLRKRKMKDEDGISKSTFGLHRQGIEAETHLDPSQMELDQAKTKTMFSMSQPELDSSNIFDIPSPPPLTTNQSESSSPFFDKSQSAIPINTQSEAKDPLKNRSGHVDAPKETKAPIATIPELQLENPVLSEEKENIPVHDNSSKSDSNSAAAITHTETTSDAGYQTAPILPASLPHIMLGSSYHKAAVVESVSSSNSQCDNDIPQQSHTIQETSVAESTVTLSHHQPDAPDTADSTSSADKPSLASADSNTDTTITESAPALHSDNFTLSTDYGFVPQEISISHSERSNPGTAKSVTKTSAISSKKSPHPVNQNAVYGALYESLFPQSFTSEVMSEAEDPLRNGSDLVDAPKETYTPIATIPELQLENPSLSAEKENIHIHDNFSKSDSSSSATITQTERHTETSPETAKSVTTTYAVSSEKSPCPVNQDAVYGALYGSLFSQSFTSEVMSFPVVQNAAPPIYDYATSQGTDTQVTDSIRKVILVKELVSDEVSSDTGHPSSMPEKMIPAKSLEMKMETTDPPQQVGRLDGYQSPTYLSMGSDDGSALEIYYSAEEDNEETGVEERFMLDEREEIGTIDWVKEVIGLHQEIHYQGEIAERDQIKRDDKEFKGQLLKIQNEEGKMGREEKREDDNSRTEAQQKLRGQSLEAQVQETGRFVVANDEEIKQKEVSTTVFSHVKEEGQEERKEELLATPVQQADTPMVCDLAPPSSEWHGERDISKQNWTKVLETEDHTNGEKQLPSPEKQYLTYKDSRSCENIHATARNTREKDLITPNSKEAAGHDTLTGESDKRGEVGKEKTKTNSNLTTSAAIDASGRVEVVTSTLIHSSEVQSDATEIEHNRALQRSEWVDTITTKTVLQQVAAELSTPNTDRPCTEAADTLSERGQEHLKVAQLDPNQGSLTSSRLLLAASDVFGSENQPSKADQESVDKMKSVYGSRSTTLPVGSSSPAQQDDSKHFREASLISEGDTSQDTVHGITSTGAGLNGADSGSKYRWKNRFEGISQYKPYRMEVSAFSESLSYRMSDSNFSTSSALPKATAYKHQGNAFSSSSPFPEEHTTPANMLTDGPKVYLSYEGEPADEQRDDWRRSLVKQEEPAAPAGERQRQRDRETEGVKSHWDSQQLPLSGLSSAQQTSSDNIDRFQEDDNDASLFTGVFQATLVELIPDPAAPPSTPPSSPDSDSPNQLDMDILVDTLKSMGPSLRSRNSSLRAPAPVLHSSLPPIVEDSSSPVVSDVPDSVAMHTEKMEATGNAAESPNGLYTLPSELGLKRSFLRDGRSPLEMIRQNHQEQAGMRDLNSPLRTSGTHNLLTRKSPDSSPEDFPVLNGNAGLPPGSRLDNSVIFGRTSSIDQTMGNRQAHRSLFRTSSLPETGLLRDRMSVSKEFELGTTDPGISRFERFSFLLNPSSPTPGTLIGAEDHSAHMSWPPLLGISSPPLSNSPTRLLSPTGSIDLHRPFTPDSPRSTLSKTHGMGVGTGRVGAPILQRSLSDEATVRPNEHAPLFKVEHGGAQFQSQEPERNLAPKYRAFPDAYLTKEKKHGKLNPRPGKIHIFDRPGMCGQRTEVRSDVTDATSWVLQETISIRVIRGGWVLYEKPNFKGEKIALDEGDIELTFPFGPPEEQQENGHEEGQEQKAKPASRFIIGSLRRAVKDYSVPEISLFPEKDAEGKKVIFRDTSDDARIFGFPVKANSIIINAGLWLVYAHPFFQGVPRVLEVGGYSNPEAWGVEQPYVGSLHPLKIGEPKVENMCEPKMVIYQKPYFTGKSRTITTSFRDFMTRTDQEPTALMHNVGSLKVLGGIWVGYEKPGFRGHQYLLEEGEYHDWRVWGGCDSELRSVRVIRADLTDPLMVMFEQQEEEQEDRQEDNSFEVMEAIPDVELFEYKIATRSIQVLSGAWIAYSHVDYSGSQYILEKGFYNNCADWGSNDNRICSVQPILMAPSVSLSMGNQILIYPEPNFKGECQVIDRSEEAVSEKRLTKSCKVSRGSWVIYDDNQYSGNSYVLSEGDYPNLVSMGCPPDFTLHSVKAVPMTFCIPSISLFGLECLEGREITMETEILSMVEEGFNNHILSLRVNSGCWVICEHSNYRGRQFLLEPIEITNWVKFSSLQTVGSMYPVRQKRRFFRIKNKERGHFMSIQGGVEEMKSGRVVVTPEVEPISDIWYYQDGFIKSKLSPNMSLQVMGNVEPGAKVVLWTETRQPIQTWTAQMSGLITSLTFPGMVLDIKGGKAYDKDHVVVLSEDDERPSQQWEIELL